MTGLRLGERVGGAHKKRTNNNHHEREQAYEPEQSIVSYLTLTVGKPSARRQKAVGQGNGPIGRRFVVRLEKASAAGRSDVARGGDVIAGAAVVQSLGLMDRN